MMSSIGRCYPVVAATAVPAEASGLAGTRVWAAAESLGTVLSDAAVQLEWLDAIEAALAELRRRQVRDPALSKAARLAGQLRAAIASPAAPSTRALWLGLLATVSALFLQHFSAAVGDDLGHATAHKIIAVLASLSQSLNP
jgi:hypothetical protein